ncbi:MAG TPA: VacJ family lipoprotein [Janthinobacterium sp.]|nr:VacJ family lipoprotein [Janthinobacterium sp.]
MREDTSGRAGPSAIAASLLLCAILGGCATGPDANPRDPLEPFNRAVFKVNDKVDRYVAVPLAKGYQKVTPSPLRTAVTNFFSNLGDVGNAVNNLLQGKGDEGFASLARVAVNTVFGIGGLFDVATRSGLKKHPQDLGLTLGVWGIPSGPYLVLPLFGPSSFRDGAGVAGSFKLDPANYAKPALRNSLYGVNIVNTRANLLGASELLSLAALDPYTFTRDAYLQQRNYLIQDGRGGARLPDYDDPGDTNAAPADAPRQEEEKPRD